MISDGERGSVTAPLGVRDFLYSYLVAVAFLDFSVLSLGYLWNSFQVISRVISSESVRHFRQNLSACICLHKFTHQVFPQACQECPSKL